jgi:hypothetical protein
MARRRKSSGMNQYMWYALYAVGGYYLYNWWKGPTTVPTITQQPVVVVPPPTA